MKRGQGPALAWGCWAGDFPWLVASLHVLSLRFPVTCGCGGWMVSPAGDVTVKSVWRKGAGISFEGSREAKLGAPGSVQVHLAGSAGCLDSCRGSAGSSQRLPLAAALLKLQRARNEGDHSSPAGCRAGHRPGASPELAFFPPLSLSNGFVAPSKQRRDWDLATQPQGDGGTAGTCEVVG